MTHASQTIAPNAPAAATASPAPQTVPETRPAIDLAARHSMRKDMCLTPAEFARALPKAVQGTLTRTGEGDPAFRVTDGDRVAIIRTRPLPDRKVGALNLPRLDVEIELRGYDSAEADRFTNRFNLAFLRMGG